MRYLDSEDPMERLVMQVVANRVLELERKRDDERALKIRNQVVKGFGGS